MLALVNARGLQKGGVCALRTQNLSDPDSWRAWGGEPLPSWNVDLVNPYPTEPTAPGDHVCTPVSLFSLETITPRAVYWNRYLNKFVLVGTRGGWVAYSHSDDLLNWSRPQDLMRPNTEPGPCLNDQNEPTPLENAGYTTMLDKTDPANSGLSGPADEPLVTPNFDHPGRSPYLFFTRGRSDGVCERDLDSDIVRVPIRIEARRAILDNGISGTDDSYDQITASGGSTFAPGTGGDYENEGTIRHAVANNSIVNASSRWAYGTFNLKGGNLDDADLGDPQADVPSKNTGGFWYSSAFFLPKDTSNCDNDFICENTIVDIMRWESTGFFGGVRLKTNNQFQLVRGSSTAGTVSTDIGAPFDLPTGRTFWLEVHQTLSNTAGGLALNEVYVDGRLVMSSTAANRGAETSGSNPTHVIDTSSVRKVKYGFVHNSSPVGTNSFMTLDSSSVTGGQLGALGAPATPTGLHKMPPISQTWAGLYSNPVVGDATHLAPTGYRWYRLNPGEKTWQIVGESAASSFIDTTVSCGNAYQYRVTAYWAPDPNSPWIDTKESIPSDRVINVATTAC